MAKHILFNDINDLIERIKEQNQCIQSYEGKVPQIELDLLMNNLRRLYDDFYELNKANARYKVEASPASDAENILETDDKELVTIISDPEPQPVTAPEPVMETSPEPTKESEPVPEMITRKPEPVKPEPVEEVQKVEPVRPEPVKKTVKKGSTADLFAESENITIADKFKTEKKTFHDKIAGDNPDKTLADTLLKPISDLRTGIGVNDRFVFINELFGGSMTDYQTAIEEINKQPDLAHAEKILQELQGVMGWKESFSSLHKLKEFIHRRFR